MKKIYITAILGTIFALFTSLNASAQVSSIADLYGKYELSFTMDDAEYKSSFSIEESDNQHYKKGMIVGLLEGDNLYINDFDAEANTITVNNPTYSQTQGMYYANEKGNMPFAKDATEENFKMVITYDPATKALTFPDMTLVTCDFQAWTTTPLVLYTDITATYAAAPEKKEVDWTGTWTVAKGNNDMNYGTGKYDYPESFTFTVIEDGGKFYVTEFLSKNIEAITYGGFELKTDGDKATIADGQLVGMMEDGTALYVTGPYGGDIELQMIGNEIKNTSWGFLIQEGALGDATVMTNAYYYGCSTYTKQAAPSDVDYSGTYTAAAVLSMDQSNGEAPTAGEIVIENKGGEYIVTNFMGYTPFTMDYKSMVLTPDAADPTKATLSCTMLKMHHQTDAGEFVYWGLADGNLTTSPVAVTFDEDGTMHIGEFCIASYTYNSSFVQSGDAGLVAWYSSLTATKGGEADAIAAPVQNAGVSEYYDLNGVRIAAPQKGINIVRMGGVTRKMIVK